MLLLNSQKTQEDRLKKNLEIESSKSNLEMMKTITETLKKKSAETGDDYFTLQLLTHLKQIPESKDKELLKLKLMSEVVNFKYSD